MATRQPDLGGCSPDSRQLSGAHAFVTGASRGIGAAIAVKLASHGAAVTAFGRSAQALDRLVASIESAGGTATVAVGDVTQPDTVRAALDEMPQLDVFVNNAGINVPEPVLSIRPESVARMLEVNVAAVILGTQLAATRMIEQGRHGVIVSLSSTLGHVGGPGRSVYAATKHAVEGFTRSVCAELAAHGIRAVTVAPAFVETDMTAERLAAPAFRASVEHQIPLGRLVSRDEVADAVAFLASPAAASITGSSLVLDGGLTADCE